jgi:hypothetical protein
MTDVSLLEYQKFTKSMVDGDDEDLNYLIYERIGEQNPSYPDNIFPIGLYREVIQRNPTFVEINGWGKLSAPTIEALIIKIVRAYESVKSERWAERITKKDEGMSAGRVAQEG